MKNFYIVQGLESDVSVTWDVDEETFVVSVASNRLPTIDQARPTENIQKMAQYFEALRLGMKPIGKPFDGVVEKRPSLEQTLVFLYELEENGYVLPAAWEKTLKNKVSLQKEKKEKSWAFQKQSLQHQQKKTAPSKKKASKNKKGG